MKTLRTFKKGEKQFLILALLYAFSYDGLRYTDIIKFAYELSYGLRSYTREQRGYWSGAFVDRGWGTRGWIPRLTYKKDGRYFINDEGVKKMFSYCEKNQK